MHKFNCNSHHEAAGVGSIGDSPPLAARQRWRWGGGRRAAGNYHNPSIAFDQLQLGLAPTTGALDRHEADHDLFEIRRGRTGLLPGAAQQQKVFLHAKSK